MKNLFVLLTLICTYIFSLGQATVTREVVKEDAVPLAVKNTQTVIFPNTTVDRWEKASGTIKGKSGTKYIAIFKQFDQRVRARFQEDGSGISATTYYAGTKLPQAIQDAAAANYAGYKLRSGERIQSLKGNQKFVFRIRLRKGSQKLVVYVDENGKEMEKKSVPSEMTEDEGVEG
ncbi:MAG: hypothetical protein AAF694_04960 [Bacteroidota bacterium]